MTRRRFLTFLGTGSAALAAGSSGVLVGCSEGQEEGANQRGSQNGEAAQAPTGGTPSFRHIEPSDADELVPPEGFKYDIIRSAGDPLTSERVYGDHNDFVAYFPMDALEGGGNSGDGILWVNHEYINPMFWSNHTDTEGATRKTKEQIAREKAGVGGAIVRVKKEGDNWSFVEGDELNRRIDATTPMDVTGPAAGSAEMQGNFYGQIIRISEKGDDPAAEEFTYEVFAAGGPQTGFASPDNLMFDAHNNLWVITDISSDKLNAGIYTTFKNNGAFGTPYTTVPTLTLVAVK